MFLINKFNFTFRDLTFSLSDIFLALFAFVLPISLAISNVLLSLLCLSSLLEGKPAFSRIKFFQSKWMMSICILALCYIASYCKIVLMQKSFIEEDVYRSLSIIIILLSLPFLYYRDYSVHSIRFSSLSFLTSMFFSAIYALLQPGISVKEFGIIHLDPNWPYSAFMQYNDHNVFLAFAIILSFFFFLKLKSNLKLLMILYISTYIFSLFNERGAAGWAITFIFFGLYSIYFFRKNIKMVFLTVSSIVFIGFLIYDNVPLVKHTVNHKVSQINSDDRYELSNKTLKLILKQPLIGYGIGSWREEFKNEYGSDFLNSSFHKTSHNNYLHIWMELGALGLALLVSIFYFQIVEMHKKGFFYTLVPIMFLFLMFIDTYFMSPLGSLLYVLMSILFTKYSCKHV